MKCTAEDSCNASWKRTEADLKVIAEYIQPEDRLEEITCERLLAMRGLLEMRERRGNGWKNTHRLWTKSSCNLSTMSSILNRCAMKKWGKMLAEVPDIPMFDIPKKTPKWLTREQAHTLLGRFPEHTRDMSVFALATGLRVSNVTHLEWARVDLDNRRCWIDGYQTKSGEPIPVPLNDDAIQVLLKWKRKHAEAGEKWTAEVHSYVFVYERLKHAPIQTVTTKMWRREAAAAGLKGVTFHTLRHAWASWNTQAGTPLRILQELGGWASIDMPAQHYGHLNPGALAEHAHRSLLGASPPKVPSLNSTPSESSASHCSGGAEGNRDYL
ncbi:MAG: site-specific integrase [Proteobacteria bacterium]|nr:site-specific integrase [Pseudomonadota bacterium]